MGYPQVSAPCTGEGVEVATDWGSCAHSGGRERRWRPNEAHEPALVGAPPSACRGRGRHMGREAAMATPPFARHSTMALCLCGRPGFLRGLSWLQSSSLLSPRAVSAQPAAVLSPGLLSKPHVPAPSPCPYLSGWVMQRCGMTVCGGLTLSCLPQTGCYALLRAPKAPFCLS